ncbi:putative myotubularin [Operophtera brumata]|uniref:Putative myotubularin n=1 Tax=Operophtera brumata TaxID=104452 RepID=A0A0L7LT99_OPEBR|nr:putative myotubularin [Operophtera brumata]
MSEKRLTQNFTSYINVSSPEYCQRNYLVGTYDVPLTCVGAVWLTDGGPNMKVLTFSFANSPMDHGRKIALALMHHAFPKRHDLLFAFECREEYHMHLPSDMNITVLDYNLMESARHFRSGRVPVWVWGRAEGAALLRSGELLQTEHFVTGAGGNVLPPLPALQTSYKKLIQDSQYYSILDSSRWLRHVANCIAFADEAARQLSENVTVVLQEGDGVDYSAVVSSLTQLLVDPYFRTISGFQSLVQKEWTAPVFLLFLDCVWQLTRQFPAQLQFSETYLTTLWDTAHNHLFDTFLFNCARDRELAVQKVLKKNTTNIIKTKSRARPAGAVHVGGRRGAVGAVLRALAAATRRAPRGVRTAPCLQPAAQGGGEHRYTTLISELWAQCYERWLLPLDAPHAGYAQHHVFNLQLREAIHYTDSRAVGAVLRALAAAARRAPRGIQRCQEKLASLSILGRHAHANGGDPPEATEPPRAAVARFHPFSLQRGDVTPHLDTMHVSLVDATQLLDSQSLLNAAD